MSYTRSRGIWVKYSSGVYRKEISVFHAFIFDFKELIVMQK